MHLRLPIAVLLFGAVACHQTLVTDGPGASTTGTMRDAGAAPDAGPADASMPDEGPPDFGDECIAQRIDVGCTGPDRVDPPFANEPFALRMAVGGPGECFCGESVECAVRRAGEALSIDTAVCSRGPLCDACFPFAEGLCEIPALPPGRYPVSVNGEPALVLDLAPRPMGSFAVLEACYGTAPIPEDPACGSANTLQPEFFIAPDEICVPDNPAAGRVTFR